MRVLWVAVLAGGTLVGCKQDQGIVPHSADNIAVTAGDFDDVAAPLNRMVVRYTTYDGIISVATWDPDYDSDFVALKVESLLGNADELRSFDTVFVASGTRGLGLRRYNGLEPDDQIVSNPNVADNLRNFTSRGGALIVSDWAYDLVERTWPEYITFVGEDADLDAAQKGEILSVDARVVDDQLAADLESDTVALEFNYSNWAVMESVRLAENDERLNTKVWLRGDVAYRLAGSEGVVTLDDVPLLVSFEPDGQQFGRVVVSSFHLDAQTEYVVDQMLRTIVGDFKEDDPEATPVGY